MKILRREFLLLSFVASSLACTAQSWKVAKFSEFNMCLDPAYEWKESRIGGVLGSHLEYVIGSFPYTSLDGEERMLHITLRPATGSPPETEAIETPEENFDPSLGLYLYELEDGTEMAFAPSESSIVKNAYPASFKATCREALHRYCTRSFHHGEVRGSYSFARESLEDWGEWERGLAKFLSKNVVRRCSDLQKK